MMEIGKKKVLFIPLDGCLTEGGELTDFRIRRDILDRIRQTGISRMIIIIGDSEDKDYNVKVKSIEFFVFAYCKIAVSSHERSENLLDEVMQVLPHNMRKKDHILSVGEHIEGIDYIELKDFLDD